MWVKDVLRWMLLLSTMLMVACTTTQPEVVVEHRTMLIAPPSAMLAPCEVEPPPEQDLFMRADEVATINMLRIAWIKQTSRLDQCNTKLGVIRQWSAEQRTIIENADKSTQPPS